MLTEAIDIPVWLLSDRETGHSERVRRDREIGFALVQRAPAAAPRDIAQVLAWWRCLHESDSAMPVGPGARIARLCRWVGLAVVLFGLVGGAGLAAFALTYDGTRPVNLIVLVGLTVALPAVLMLLNVLTLWLGARRRRSLAAGIRGLKLGYWAGLWIDRLFPEEALFQASVGQKRARQRYANWQLFSWSQRAGLAFSASACATALVLVASTDIAFGWSTTLDLSPQAVAAVVGWLASPWAQLLPEAAPGFELVADSRFFRLRESPRVQDPAALGQWWKFYVMLVAVYGIVPRGLLLLASAIGLRGAMRRLLLDEPEVGALLDRLRSPRFETLASGSDAGPSDLEGDIGGDFGDVAAHERKGSEETGQGRALTLGWNGAGLGQDLGARVAFGAGLSLAAEQAQLAALPSGLDSVTVLVKGYEPPLHDFEDFLVDLRAALGSKTTIRVVPLNEAGGPSQSDSTRTWARALARIDDPRLFLAGLE